MAGGLVVRSKVKSKPKLDVGSVAKSVGKTTKSLGKTTQNLGKTGQSVAKDLQKASEQTEDIGKTLS